MKILALGDPHGKLPKNLDRVINKNKIELIVCIGDIPPVPKNFARGGDFPLKFKKRANKSFEDIVRKLSSYKLPILTLRGNMYLVGENNIFTKKLFSKYKNLFYKKTGKIKIKGKNFIFYDMSYEPYMFNRLDTFRKQRIKANPSREKRLNNLLKQNPNVILVCHNPPYNCLDKIQSGKHVGSKILRKAIEKHRPKLVLCGHIHEAKGKKKIGKTQVINLGCCGDYKIIKI